MSTILLVDDEPDILEVLEMALRDENIEILRASSGGEALSLVEQRDIDIVISDIRMPDLSGVDLLKNCAAFSPATAFIMMTAFADTETAIEALQHGASDYLTKPFQISELTDIVRRVLNERSACRESPIPKADADAQQGRLLFRALNRSRLLGKSARMLEIFRTIGTISVGDSTVLIMGESGTGKELVARAVHEASPRKNGPFVSINCGAFPETLLESELFGYMKGAFTGAANNRKGLFEAAGGGSIFLDEVTEMTPAMQVKVLRVLQERKLRPLGSTTEIPVNVRVLAATNRDLAAMIRSGSFREDLYYRLAVIVLELPPLRERKEDIEILAGHFLRHFAGKTGKKIQGLSSEALNALRAYPWPGNVRELENTIERAVAMESRDTIRLDRLPELVPRPVETVSPASKPTPSLPIDLEKHLAEVERSIIYRALEEAGGNQTAAAELLNITKPSLRHKLLSLEIETSQSRRKHVQAS